MFELANDLNGRYGDDKNKVRGSRDLYCQKNIIPIVRYLWKVIARSSCDRVERYGLIDLFKFSYIYDRSGPAIIFPTFLAITA